MGVGRFPIPRTMSNAPNTRWRATSGAIIGNLGEYEDREKKQERKYHPILLIHISAYCVLRMEESGPIR